MRQVARPNEEVLRVGTWTAQGLLGVSHTQFEWCCVIQRKCEAKEQDAVWTDAAV